MLLFLELISLIQYGFFFWPMLKIVGQGVDFVLHFYNFTVAISKDRLIFQANSSENNHQWDDKHIALSLKRMQSPSVCNYCRQSVFSITTCMRPLSPQLQFTLLLQSIWHKQATIIIKLFDNKAIKRLHPSSYQRSVKLSKFFGHIPSIRLLLNLEWLRGC